MNYSDYKKMIEKEYGRNRKNIFTCYFFLAISVVFFGIFFFQVRELAVVGAAFLLDLAAAVYALRAFQGVHPYWEMQLALKAKAEPCERTVCRFAAGVEYALEHQLPAFRGRALEIFEETFRILEKSSTVSRADLTRLEEVLKRTGQ